MWEWYNGIYGWYRVNEADSYWVGIGTHDLMNNIYQRNNLNRYLLVKWTNMKNSDSDDDQGRATLYIMLDTSYMSAS